MLSMIDVGGTDDDYDLDDGDGNGGHGLNDSAGGDRGDGGDDDCAVGDDCIGVIIMFTMIRGTQRQFVEFSEHLL